MTATSTVAPFDDAELALIAAEFDWERDDFADEHARGDPPARHCRCRDAPPRHPGRAARGRGSPRPGLRGRGPAAHRGAGQGAATRRGGWRVSAWQILDGDCIEAMAGLPAASVGAVVTDPPYGIHFMNKTWDKFGSAIGVDHQTTRERSGSMHAGQYDYRQNAAFQEWCEQWGRECLRLLKPGGYLVSFGSPRTYHRLASGLDDAGFEVRDSLHWLFGSGFPKSLDVERGIAMDTCPLPGRHFARRLPDEDKRQPGDHVCPVTPESAPWVGYGTAMKPAHEPIVLARKPLAGTYAANVARWGVGGLNIDGCRVGLNGERPPTGSGDRRGGAVYAQDEWTRTQMANGGNETSALGRWPTNLLLTHHPDCMPVGTRQIRSNGHHPSSRGAGGLGTNGHRGQEGLSERHAAGETVDAWSCVPGCPVAILDGQSGERKAGGYVSGLQASATGDSGIYGHFDRIENRPYDDGGGASRFYPAFRFEADDFAPFLYVAKAARSEREKGLRTLAKASPGERTGRVDGSAGLDSPRAGAGRTNAGANAHPTVKPVQLMRWLVRLVTPPGETVLDPFLGSGTTGVAALMEGRRFVGIEREAAYLAIARRRLEATQPGFDLATAD